ncbi:hypothetical protein Tco_1277498 [Tanacetum coccineum]
MYPRNMPSSTLKVHFLVFSFMFISLRVLNVPSMSLIISCSVRLLITRLSTYTSKFLPICFWNALSMKHWKHLKGYLQRDSTFQSISGSGYPSLGHALFTSLKSTHILQLSSCFFTIIGAVNFLHDALYEGLSPLLYVFRLRHVLPNSFWCLASFFSLTGDILAERFTSAQQLAAEPLSCPLVSK